MITTIGIAMALTKNRTNTDGKQYWINGTDGPNDREWIDSDSDGFGDNMDVFPYDENESSDLDNDGIEITPTNAYLIQEIQQWKSLWMPRS